METARDAAGRLGALPITLGADADEILSFKGVSVEHLVKVVQIRLHSTGFEQFAYHMNVALGWNGFEALSLWRAIKFPCV